ncbi:MFS transporter, partial [Microbacterium sp. HMWF026]|uniref:MFS transporter n=1 Tax=Microbacterium sp. HMWF026 TaxID=2056861 RepID=UPI001C62849F
MIPLWAGLVLGLDATAIGLLVAVELAVSCLARPLAGRVADRGDRRRVASVGALVSGLGAAGYALATSASSGFAFLAAIVGGLGGSLLWVAVRAIVSEEHVSRPSAFAGLLAAEETGAAVAFVVGLSALGAIGYSALFLLAGASCVIGAVVLASLPPDAAGRARQPGPARAAA